MTFALKYIRKIILSLSVIGAVVVYVGFTRSVLSQDLARVYIGRTYALTALTFLYFALLASPLYAAFPRLRSRLIHIQARRALGVSAFFFAALHASIEFFWLLGGFAGLSFLSAKYIRGISFSFAALVILTMMAATSFNWAVSKLGSKWKMLHRFVYAAGALIVLHALMLGSHFVDVSRAIPRIFFCALFVLLVLEAIRFEKYITQKFPDLPKAGILVTLYAGVFVLLILAYNLFGGSSNLSLNVHSSHLHSLQTNLADQFEVRLVSNERAIPGKDTTLTFSVFNKTSGLLVTNFETIYEKQIHVVIVNSSLTYFAHVHPPYANGLFTLATDFPKDDEYHVYFNFEPTGAGEQQYSLRFPVGSGAATASSVAPDVIFTKTFGDYKVQLLEPDAFWAKDLSAGHQLLTFGIFDAKTNAPVTTLQPYLGAFGHLVLINEQTYDYVHVHPTVQNVSAGNAGPAVEFMPLGLNGPIKPGVYRVFAEFNPNGKLIVADFTIEIQ